MSNIDFSLEQSSFQHEWSDGRMYALTFDLQQDCLSRYYPGTDVNAYGDIRRVLVSIRKHLESLESFVLLCCLD